MSSPKDDDSADPVTSTALRAWRALAKAHDGGDFGAYLAMLTEDYVFSMPLGEFRGQNVGRERAEACFRVIAASEPHLHYHDPLRVSRQGDTVVIEFEDDGTIFGQPYRNRIASSFDVRGDKICGYREYFGDIDPDWIAKATGR